MAQAKARHPEFPGRFFNVGFVLEPRGRGHPPAPQGGAAAAGRALGDPAQRLGPWIELYGRNLDAFYPVADTEIGRLGVLMANEGSYPENARGLAMNGAEVVYRGSYPHPHVGNGLFEIQNRARALDNNFYVIACNVGTYYLHTDSDVADRHVRRRLGGHRLPGPDRRAARLQRRVRPGWPGPSTSRRCATSAPTRSGTTG